MPFRLPFTAGAALIGTLALLTSQPAPAQRGPRPPEPQAEAPAQPAVARPHVVKPFPPRAAPTDYQAHAQAGAVTIAAEFDGNSLPTPDATYTDETYVTVEIAIFGAPGTKLKLSLEDFTLRLNGRKSGAPAQPYEMLFKSLKDPEWAPPVDKEGKSKGGLNAGGGGGGKDDTPVVIHMPPEMQRAMEQNVQNAAFPEGERTLPLAGLLHFNYGGNANKLKSIELVYAGAAGKATLTLK